LTNRLQDVLQMETRCFVCNTDRRQGSRTPTGGYVHEEAMHHRGFAAAWEKFRNSRRMQDVKAGDVIFMFAKGVGIIGVGVATGSAETLPPNRAGRLSNRHGTVEWRIPTRWLAWTTDDEDAYRWKSPNATFLDVNGSKYAELRNEVKEHFLDSM